MDQIYLHIFSIFAEKKPRQEPVHEDKDEKHKTKAIKQIVLHIMYHCNKSHSYLPNR